MTSSSVVSMPSETRKALAAASSSNPSAPSTRLTFTLPDEHAEPADTAKPARSIAITCVSPFHPGVAKQLVLGNLFASFPTKIVFFSAASMAFSRIFLSCATRSQRPAAKSACAATQAAPIPAIATTFSVPDLRPISCPPPLICAAIFVPAGKISAPTPFGPPNLCADKNTIRTPDHENAKGTFPKPWVMSLTAKPAGSA